MPPLKFKEKPQPTEIIPNLYYHEIWLSFFSYFFHLIQLIIIHFGRTELRRPKIIFIMYFRLFRNCKIVESFLLGGRDRSLWNSMKLAQKTFQEKFSFKFNYPFYWLLNNMKITKHFKELLESHQSRSIINNRLKRDHIVSAIAWLHWEMRKDERNFEGNIEST